MRKITLVFSLLVCVSIGTVVGQKLTKKLGDRCRIGLQECSQGLHCIQEYGQPLGVGICGYLR